MKTKLTVTIDKELVPRAKRYAEMRGVSLSRLIESSLRDVTAGESGSFSQRWRGKFKAAERDDDLYRALARKHL